MLSKLSYLFFETVKIMKQKGNLILLFSGIFAMIIIFGLIIFQNQTENVNYKIEECKRSWSHEEKMLVEYNELTKTLTAYVWVNCCGTEVKVEKKAHTYKIVEKQYGTLCRCMCIRKVVIFNASKEYKVIFINKDGNKFILAPVVSFCGWSTYGKCNSNADCVVDGCSSQVCRSKFEQPITTICEWLDCYDKAKFRIACKCIDKKCQWTRE